MPKCTINGVAMEVKPGTTIIQAIKELNQDIAHYCWHPALSIAGVCRLCMVQIEGQPKLQIACNTVVTEGMVVNNTSPAVKEAVKWGLDFHLINHPLDCPICDQAGECGLQDQYMKFGQYDPEMSEHKQKKHKVVDLGPTIVLDTERCILCSRCVRFTDEVSKTNELRIINRGDRAEIGTFTNKPLDNNYSLNTVDICPVGALTSKDFRFRQRVWYMKESPSICTGCSTGCNISVHHNEEGTWRVKPVHNEKVNGYWMCDKGRDVYKFVNRDARMLVAKRIKGTDVSETSAGTACKEVGYDLRSYVSQNGSDKVAVVITGQYSNEENESFLNFVSQDLKVNNVYHWINNPAEMEKFDGLLYRGDKNPNTTGLKSTFSKIGGAKAWSELEKKLSAGGIEWLIVAGPEMTSQFPDLNEKLKLFSASKNVVWLSAAALSDSASAKTSFVSVPLKTFIEKDGTYTNFAGIQQSVKRGTTIVAGALTLTEATTLIAGKEIDWALRPSEPKYLKQNFFTEKRGQL
jgi:NADH-quinone oxidoreductase subunit G